MDKIKYIVIGLIMAVAGSVFAQGLPVYRPVQGGTGTGAIPALGQVLVGTANGVYVPQATSSLGFINGSGVSGNCVQWLVGNTLGDAGAACGSGGGSSFSTTSANYWASVTNLFSTTSAAYFLSQNQGNAFSTTSATYFLGQNQGLAFSTTSANYWKTQNLFTGASTTLLGDNNTFSGNDTFNNTITGSISGNAGTATKLQNARTINNVSFDGTGNITITAASSTLLGDNNLFSGVDSFTATTTHVALQVTPTTNTSASITTGGAFNLNNTANAGAGAVFTTSHGSGATGRLAVFNCAGANFDQDCVVMQALDVNSNQTVLNIQASSTGKGGLKIETKSTNGGTGGTLDAGASALSIDVQGSGSANTTAAQGIFINSTGSTTGALIQWRQQNVQLGELDSNGQFGLGTTTPGSILSLGTTGGINFTYGTSTFGTGVNGLNINNGCYAIKGTCIGGSSTAASSTLLSDNNTFSGVDTFTNASSNFSGTWQTFAPSHFQIAGNYLTAYDSFTHPSAGQSATTSLMLLYGNASTTGLSANYASFGKTATTSIDTAGNIILTGSSFIKDGGNILFGGNGVNTLLRPDSSGGVVQIQAFNGSTNTSFLDNGNVGLATGTPGTILSAGTGATSFNISNTATSTFGSGLNINTGCYAIGGTCLSTSGGTSPGGSDTDVQFNNSGSFGGDSNLTYNNLLPALTINGTVFTPNVESTSGTDLTLSNVNSAAIIDLTFGGDITLFPGPATNVKFVDPSSGKNAIFDTSIMTDDRTFSFPDSNGTFTLGSGFTPGDCIDAVDAFTVGDAGAPCPSGGGSSFSTTSANYWASVTNLFSTTSAAYFLSQNQGNAFSTTSANYWKTQTTFTGASTTLLADNNLFSGVNKFSATTTNTTAIQVGATSGDNALKIDASGRIYPASVSTGGALNINEGTESQFPALVAYGDSSGVGTGRLAVLEQDGTAVTQDMILASSSCANCTALNLKGNPTGKGILKIEFLGAATGQSNGSAISLDTSSGDAQAVFIKSGTGIPLNIQNSSAATLFKIDKSGNSTTTGYIEEDSTATSTFVGGISAKAFAATSGTATSTFADGLDLAGGCFAINHVCIGTVTAIGVTTNQGVSGSSSGGATPNLTLTLGALTGVTSFNGLVVTANTGAITTGSWAGTTIPILHGGTNETTETTNGINYFDGSGITNSSKLTFNGTDVGIGTSTPRFLLDLATSTKPQISLQDGNNVDQWTMRGVGGNLYFATSSATTFATSTQAALSLNSNAGSPANFGIGTSSTFSILSVVRQFGSAPLFAVASSTVSGSNMPNVEVDAVGHIITSGPIPTVSGGTSSMGAKSNDTDGSITVVGTALTSVTMTFANAFATAPVCTESDNQTSVGSDITSISTTQVVFGFGVGGVTSATIWYHCDGTQ